jgi:arylformamidase
MRRGIDLTGLIEEGMWLDNPLVPPPVIEQVSGVDGPAGWEAHRITLSTLTGTYLEASAHLFPGGETIDRVGPERLICPACILELPECPPGHAIDIDELARLGAAPEQGEAVLISTGWERRWNRPGFIEDSPYFTLAAIEWLAATGAGIVGADLPSFDHPQQPAGVLRALFGHGLLLLAPLVNLRGAAGTFQRKPLLAALPLKVKGVCGMPCRAILFDPLVD